METVHVLDLWAILLDLQWNYVFFRGKRANHLQNFQTSRGRQVEFGQITIRGERVSMPRVLEWQHSFVGEQETKPQLKSSVFPLHFTTNH